MPVLRTDDVVRRQRALWLGPPGHRWPFDATYVAWALGFGVGLICVGAGLTGGVVLGGKTLWPLGLLAGVAVAWWLTRALMRLVDFDRPLRYWRQAAADERRGKKSVGDPTSARVELRWQRIEVPSP